MGMPWDPAGSLLGPRSSHPSGPRPVPLPSVPAFVALTSAAWLLASGNNTCGVWLAPRFARAQKGSAQAAGIRRNSHVQYNNSCAKDELGKTRTIQWQIKIKNAKFRNSFVPSLTIVYRHRVHCTEILLPHLPPYFMTASSHPTRYC